MGTKHTSTCLAKAHDDEPVFVLRAQDKLAPMVIEFWAYLADKYGAPEQKIIEANELIAEMKSWRLVNRGKYPD
jgi:hypothetical protein